MLTMEMKEELSALNEEALEKVVGGIEERPSGCIYLTVINNVPYCGVPTVSQAGPQCASCPAYGIFKN